MAQAFVEKAATVTGWSAILLCLGGLCAAQTPTPQPERPPPSPSQGTPNRALDAKLQAKDLPVAGPIVGMTLLDALRLASLSNLDIALARQVVEQAQAGRELARVIWLPNINVGSTYVDHEGRIQQANGNILDVNRNSLFVGGGPSITLGLNELLFTPPIARRIFQAAEGAQGRVTNDTMLAVSESYFNILRALRHVARVEQTLLYLTSEQTLPLTNSKGLLPLIRDFVKVGEALPSDLARVEVEVVRRREDGQQALQELRVAMAELARLLRLDPQQLLWPLEDIQWPIAIPGDAWLDCETPELIAFAEGYRPEVAENNALVRVAQAQLRSAIWKPLLPNLVTTYNAGGFGGSPNRNTSLKTNDPLSGPIDRPIESSGNISRFGARTDWDVALIWRLQNMGFGNLAQIHGQRAVREQALVRQGLALTRIAAQVVQAVSQIEQTAERTRILQAGLFDKNGRPGGPVYRSLRLNMLRIRGGQGRPLEVLDSIRGLNDTLASYASAVTDYERARFRLLYALGIPARGLLDPKCMPQPPCRASGKPGKAPPGAPQPQPMPPADEPGKANGAREPRLPAEQAPAPKKASSAAVPPGVLSVPTRERPAGFQREINTSPGLSRPSWRGPG
jgi:outer membrane protein TolC